MKRLVLSLVTALSLMGAAQSFAIPVPVVETIPFRTANVDSGYATFVGSNTTKYSAPIATRLFADPLSHLPGSFDGTSFNSPDSSAWATVRLIPLANSAVTIAADTMFFHIQVSANGVDWLTWTPVATIAANVTSTDLGTNKAFAVVEQSSSNSFAQAIRVDVNSIGYPYSPTSATNYGMTAATFTDAKGLLAYPLMRVVWAARASAGQFKMELRYYTEKVGVFKRVDEPLSFRYNSTNFASGYSDSSFASSNGSTLTTDWALTTDTTAVVSWDKLCIQPFGGGQQSDTLVYANLTITTSTNNGTTPANWDSVFVTTQISFDGSTWISSGGQRVCVETVGLDAFSIPFKTGFSTVAAWPNGGLVWGFSNIALNTNKMYGLAPLARFIIRRDVDATGAMIATLRYTAFSTR